MTDFSQYEVKEKPSSFEQYQVPPNDEQKMADPGAYLDTLASKPEESFLGKLPRNILTGLAHAGRNLHNLPHDVIHLVEGQNGPFKHPLSHYLPNDETDYSSAFGGNENNDTMMDKLIKGGIAFAPDLIGGRGLLKAGNGILKGTSYLNKAEKAAKESGEVFNYSPELVEEARNYLPRSHATNEMIKGSEAGGYTPSFSIQSQIGKHQRDLERSPLASERLLAPQVGDLKQRMLEHLGGLLESHGMKEEAGMLKKGINNYRQYTQVKNAAIPVLAKVGIPTSILAALGFGYGKAKKLLNY